VETNEIKSIISQGIPSAEVLVDGDGTHFQAVVVASDFEQKNMVQRHQMVYKSLGNRVGNEIHALTIKAYTPAEWDKQKSFGVIK